MGQARRTLVTINPKDHVVDHKEAAEMLGLSPKALYHLCYRGEGPRHVVRVSGRKRGYLASEVLELVQRRMEREGEVE